MNKLDAMATFVKIVECGSLTAAADALDTSSPTVVRTLAALEEHLKTRLLNRTTRRLTLTEEGRSYLERCRHILADIEEAENELGAQQTIASGQLSVTAPVMFGAMIITPLITQFLRLNEQVNIELLLLDRNVHLLEEGVDVAVRIGPLDDSSMIAKQVGHVRRVICGTPEFIRSFEPVRHPEDLRKIPCIGFTGLSHGSNWQFYENSKMHSIPISGPLSCNQVSASLDAVCSGIGLGMFLSYQVEKELETGELQTILNDYEPPPLPINVLFSHKRFMSTRMRVFIDWITDELRKKLGNS